MKNVLSLVREVQAELHRRFTHRKNRLQNLVKNVKEQNHHFLRASPF